jgi:predicted  nucleic acid-binding Zn-ribbon protein
MSKNSYPEELLALLQTCLTDGAISAKEREVLLKKAEKRGIDRDEFDLYIDAQEQKINQTTHTTSDKLYALTCPYCGSSIQQMTDKCPNCGNDLSPYISKEGEDIIEALENALIDVKTDLNELNIAQVERYMRKATLYCSNNPKVKKLLEEVGTELQIEKDKAAKLAKKAKNAKIRKIILRILFWVFVVPLLILLLMVIS